MCGSFWTLVPLLSSELGKRERERVRGSALADARRPCCRAHREDRVWYTCVCRLRLGGGGSRPRALQRALGLFEGCLRDAGIMPRADRMTEAAPLTNQ
eukprot:COSAG06_NODE_5063_length_3753_cov_3.724412_4_plen_98_part_00